MLGAAARLFRKSPDLVFGSVNYLRKAREENMVNSWTISSANGGKLYQGFPELEADDTKTLSRVDWWNSRLEKMGVNLKIATGATTEIHLNPKTTWI